MRTAQEDIELIRLLELDNLHRNSRNEIFEAYRQFKGRYAVLIGGSGSGKSYEIADKHIDRVVQEDGHRFLCSRAEQKQISESQVPLIVSRIKTRYADSFAAGKWKINLSKGHESITYLPNGNSFIFWGLDDPDKLKSIFDITGAWLEEADQIDEATLREIERRLRGYQGKNQNGTDKYMQISFSFNPVSESCYIKPLFFDQKEDHQLMLCGKQAFEDCTYYKDVKLPDFTEKITVWDEKLNRHIERYKVNTLVIHSTYLDNRFIDDTYSQVLQKMPEDERRVYALGQWGLTGMHFFKEFSRSAHVIDPFPLTSEHRIYRVLDYGLDKLACYWVAVDYKGRAKFYKELWESDLIISEAAKKINAMTTETIYQTIAPPDLWNRRQDTGKSAAEIFYENGVVLSRAINDREQGCFALKEWLKPYDTKDEQTGEPKKAANLQITTACPKLIWSIQGAVTDERNPNTYATEPHELTHSVDAMRYFVAGRPTPAAMPKPQPINNFSFENKLKTDPGGWGEPTRII